MEPLTPEPATDAERASRIARVIEEVILRRESGEAVSEQAVINAHATLMPELGKKLSALRQVEAAEHAAHRSDSTDPLVGDAGRFLQVEHIGNIIPGHEIVQEIHRGGQGVVYRAMQTGTGRVVAIKVMRAGPLRGPSEKARFNREIHVLARLRHPNIVAIHDSGTVGGLDYFVMDFIRGRPLDEYVAAKALDVAATLTLFVGVVRAVSAAHLRGVIHRDIKPSNVLVDEQGAPHVLDFGLAKLTGDDSQEGAAGRVMTRTGQFVGSLPWASPEQAGPVTDQIDIRTDIYSLGVILYQVLTGDFPYPVRGSTRDVLTNILETNPHRPSAMRRGLDEDVDTIVLKCLAKEPERRYQSAAGLADDVERYLNHQPILARTPSTLYQLRKLVLRHKLPSILLITLLVVIVGFAVAMGSMYRQAVGQRDRAVAAERESETRRAEAQREAERSRAIRDFLVNDLLSTAKPEVARGRDITIKEVLSNATRRVETAFSGQPELEASLRDTLASVHLSLGSYAAALTHARAADRIRVAVHGDRDPDTVRHRGLLLTTLRADGLFQEAERLSARLLPQSRRLFGPDDPDTLSVAAERAELLVQLGRGDEALELHRDTLDRRRRVLGETHADTLHSLMSWGRLALQATGQIPAAEELFRRTLRLTRETLGDNHPSTLALKHLLSTLVIKQRKFQEGERLLRDACDGLRRVNGEEHPATLSALSDLAVLYTAQDRVDEAETIARRSLAVVKRSLGELHPQTIEGVQRLCNILIRHAKFSEAAAVCRRSHELYHKLFGENHPGTAHALDTVAFVDQMLGYYARAEAGHRKALAVHQERAANGLSNPVWCLRVLVKALAAQGKLDQARPFALKLLASRRNEAELAPNDGYVLNCYARELLDVYPVDLRDPRLALTTALRAFENTTDAYHYNRYTLALAYEANGETERAIEMIERALAKIPVEDSTERRDYDATYVRLLVDSGDGRAAEQVYRDALARRREVFSNDHPDVAQSLEELSRFLTARGRHAEAEPLLRECLAIRQRAMKPGDWRIADARSLLGAAALGQGRVARADALLRTAVDEFARGEFVSLQAFDAARARLTLLDATGNGPAPDPAP